MAVKVNLSSDERGILCEVVEDQKLSLKTVAEHLAQKEWDKAEEMFRHYTQDCRLLEGLCLDGDSSGEFTLGMGGHELRESLSRMMARRTAKLVAEGSAGVPSPEREAFQERASRALSVCARCLNDLAPQHEVRHVVVDVETGDPQDIPFSALGFASDLCDLHNENAAPVDAARS